ncbi:MAG: formate acetyltransferase [Deltaproteobacteria bacterium]|nr:formate acetyltransferase [Deltaproteobacteria bacterium]
MEAYAKPFEAREKSKRFARIKDELLSSPTYLCPERACLITEYFKKHDDKTEPMILRKAKALRHLLSNKSVHIYPDELIAGNMGTRRKSALIQPELAGVFMAEEILWIERRKTTPFQIAWPDRLKLIFKVFPYWLTRNMAFRAFFPRFGALSRYVVEQLNATYYLINEAGGIGHFLPNYEKMIKLGVAGYLESMEGEEGDLHRAARIACEGLLSYATNLADEAERLAESETDIVREEELREIARICRSVPMNPAKTFHEAVQSLWLTHMAVCLEGINSAVSLGRIDQYLYPYYRADIEKGRITPEKAREILLSLSAKATEHVFLLSERTSEYHGGYLVAQATTVGGVDREGNDAVNELTYLFLDVMEESGLRDPNYLARVHAGSSPVYLRRVADVARQGNAVPAIFNDEVTVASLVKHGYPLEDARDYGLVGCVEPTIPGKSFCSTDASLFNLPLCLKLALNRGRRLKGHRRLGAATSDPSSFTKMADVIDAFTEQIEYMVARLIRDMQVIEGGNRDYHPTPFSSMLVDGCLESGKDVTEGGALFNSSGVQGIGVADVADSLAALDYIVFQKKSYAIARILEAMKNNFADDPKMHAEILSAPKFGNDEPIPDEYADLAVHIFHEALSKHQNTRGGPYVPGFYSSTCHVAFGRRTGALPSGRKAKEPFAASLGSSNGRDRSGPTALLNSVAHIDSTLSPNGYALNLRFDPHVLEGDRGMEILTALMEGFFDSGGMEMQLNVIDPEMLLDAYQHPGKHPGIVVRVAGYCAYFDDLPVTVKEEIIARTRLTA